MIIPLEDRWGLLAVLEQEHGARQALLKLYSLGELKFCCSDDDQDRESFLSNVACLYISQSLRQSKELFRQAETSSYLVKPLLMYYAMLACAKGCLAFYMPDFMKSRDSRSHGIHTQKEFKPEAELATDFVRISDVGVYRLLREALELPPLPAGLQIPIDQILSRLPEVDISYRLLLRKAEQPQDWFRISGNIVIQTGTVFRTQFSLPEGLYAQVGDRLPISVLEKYETSDKVDERQERHRLFSSKDAWPTYAAAASWGMPATIGETIDNNYALILPIEIGGERHDVAEIELMFLLLFYFSSIARYQPHLWMQLHAGAKDFSPLLCRDLLNHCENKFLKLVNSKLSYTISLPLTT